MAGVVGRISGMDARSTANLERLLRDIRFVPPPVLVLPTQPLLEVRGWWRPASLFLGASAALCLILLVFAFWTVLLGLRH